MLYDVMNMTHGGCEFFSGHDIIGRNHCRHPMSSDSLGNRHAMRGDPTQPDLMTHGEDEGQVPLVVPVVGVCTMYILKF